MRTYTHEEIDELIASGEADRMLEQARQTGDAFDVRGPALIALYRVMRRPGTTDDQLDAAIAVARQAGHGWDEIEPILHLLPPRVTAR